MKEKMKKLLSFLASIPTFLLSFFSEKIPNFVRYLGKSPLWSSRFTINGIVGSVLLGIGVYSAAINLLIFSVASGLAFILTCRMNFLLRKRDEELRQKGTEVEMSIQQ